MKTIFESKWKLKGKKKEHENNYIQALDIS